MGIFMNLGVGKAIYPTPNPAPNTQSECRAAQTYAPIFDFVSFSVLISSHFSRNNLFLVSVTPQQTPLDGCRGCWGCGVVSLYSYYTRARGLTPPICPVRNRCAPRLLGFNKSWQRLLIFLWQSLVTSKIEHRGAKNIHKDLVCFTFILIFAAE